MATTRVGHCKSKSIWDEYMDSPITLAISVLALVISSQHCACRWKRGDFAFDAELEPNILRSRLGPPLQAQGPQPSLESVHLSLQCLVALAVAAGALALDVGEAGAAVQALVG